MPAGPNYCGEWYKDKLEGYGTEKWSDGSSYEGYFSQMLKHGNGYFKMYDGSIYKG